MFNSFGIVEMSLENASEQYTPKFKINAENVDILKEYCGVIDNFIEQNKAESFDVDINDADKTIHLEIVVHEYEEDEPGFSMFVELIAHAVSFGIDWVNADNVRIRLVFPSVWEEASE